MPKATLFPMAQSHNQQDTASALSEGEQTTKYFRLGRCTQAQSQRDLVEDSAGEFFQPLQEAGAGKTCHQSCKRSKRLAER